MFSKILKVSALAALCVLASCQEMPFESQILSYDGNKVSGTYVFEGNALAEDGAGQWSVDVDRTKVSDEAVDYVLTFSMKEGEMASGGAAVQFEFDNWNTENYIFAPCYLYGGNRFKILPKGYPPFINEEKDRTPDMPVTTTNVPHFTNDGSDSYVDFKTNSCSTPLAGFYDKDAKRGFFILEEQDAELGNDAFFIYEYPSEGRLTIRLSAPGVREHRYVMCKSNNPSDDKGIALKAGDEIKMHFRVYDFPCEDLPAYFDKYFSIRKDISGQNEIRNLEPFSSIAKTMYENHAANKWYEDKNFGYYCNEPRGESPFGHLQLGWNGVPVYSLGQMLRPECQEDYDEVVRRVGRSFDSIEYMQGESGFFYGMMRRGEFIGDNFGANFEKRDVAMIRRTAIAIYYGLQSLDILRMQGYGDMIKPSWEECLRKACDALVTLFNRYGEFGQCICAETGEMYVYNSAQGVLCMGALAYASRYFNAPEYLALAEKAADYYYDNFLAKGYVGGGPAEILQAPDSESSAELVESYTALYEITRDEKWLEYARDAAAFFSTWVVSYDFKYPAGSGMERMGIKAAGSVWASVQNQHSAPGLYIMSADFLLKLYRSTGDRRYIELCRDISHNVVQYVNTEGNRMQKNGGFGYCTERVNIGDWENKVGGLADSDSNFAWESVNLFHTSQNPGIYVQPDTGEICVFDHVNAKIVSSDAESVTLEIENPTYRDGDISVLAETSEYARDCSLGWNAFYNWPKVHVPSGETVTVTIPAMKKASIDCVETDVVGDKAPSLLPAGKNFKLVWHDEFDGSSLDTTKWRYRTEFWGRDAHWFAKPEDNAVELKDGLAYLKVVKRKDGQFVSPQLQTGNLIWDYIRTPSKNSFWPLGKLDKALFKHAFGYYECRCKLQQMPGWWSAFWMQSETSGAGSDSRYAGVEQDIMESFSPGTIIPSCFHYDGYGPDHKQFISPRKSETNKDVFDIDKTVFHTFGLLWEPDGYTLYVDGVARGAKVGMGEGEIVSQIPEFILISTECMYYRNNNCTGSASPELAAACAKGDAFIVDHVRVFDITEQAGTK